MPLRRRLGALALAFGVVIAGGAIAQELVQQPGQEPGQEPAPDEQAEGAVGIGTTPPNILVVDLDRVILQSDAAQSALSRLDLERQSLQSRFAEREAELRAMQQELEAMGDEVSDEDQLARRREFEQLVADSQREVQARSSILNQARGRVMEEIRAASLQAIARIANDANAEIVLQLDRSVTVIVSTDRNITDQALTLLNELLPSVDVQLPAQE